MLVVIAIVAILAGICFSVVASAKKSANKVVAISNMHQCVQGLLIYAQDHDNEYPTRDVSCQLLDANVRWDPDDNWRRNANTDLGDPFIGSFGYVLADEVVKAASRKVSDPVLLVDLFRCDHRYPVFTGDTPDEKLENKYPHDLIMPKRIMVANQSGSVFWKNIHSPDSRSYMIISWSWIFFEVVSGESN
jgi:type II secretory pathway pseudopilin PulG